MLDRRTVLRAGAVAAAAAAGAGATGAAAAGPVAASPAGPAARRTGGGVDWSELGRRLSGNLVLPSDSGYERARKLYSGQFDGIRPQAVAYCRGEADVRTTLAFAQDHGLPLVPRSGGHSFGGYSTGEGIVLDLSRLNTVALTPRNTVVMGAGTQQVDALTALSPRGVVVAGGNCPGVCPGGFVPGGGLGWQTRKFGMACDRLVSARIVLADGRTVTASAAENPDLFWATRGGGGGNFGVITSLELRPTDVPTLVTYNLTWPWEAAQRVVEAWQHWIIGGPRDLGAALAVQWPDAGKGAPVVVVTGAWLGAADALDPVLDSLVASVGRAPATRSARRMSAHDAMMAQYGCAELSPEQCHTVGYSPEAALPRQNFSIDRNRLFSAAIPARGVEQILEAFAAGPRAGQFRFLSFFALGGAANRPDRSTTAYVHRDTEFYLGFSIALNKPDYSHEDEAAGRAWAARGLHTLDPYSNGESYQNFIDPELADWKTAYYAENYGRLTAVKRAYDPHRFFSFAQAVG
ncbi:FAD-binding protein [Streptomyces sp. NRRL B-1677]|uniref:FAD-binding oxidoreductase n=1 Tax=Streptomyces TaxID=1883 RepID=UPI001892A9A1|nr:FAD-binding oxidoreductase [Streptomyces sp. NRRL B-1677]MBF6047106.1 FAD-binding protein [Streptomyces sp. NRRL B-1677]